MTPPIDWHWEDVKAALRKRGVTIADLERRHGYAPKSLYQLKNRRWPKAQALIAAALGIDPWGVWPSRYLPDGEPLTGTLGSQSSNADGAGARQKGSAALS